MLRAVPVEGGQAQSKDPLGLGFLDGLDETWAKEEESQEVNTIKTMNCDDFADMLEGEY